MASQSLYRKWRSQTFSDLIGQEAVTRTLLNAVRDGRLAHAYLFCGPRGTGKTSAARLLAKAINCEHPQNGEPCNECLSCREITAGRSPDVIEIDAASNTGVDSIRELRENVNLMGSGGHHKVYVIDETHMLSTAAFNALLKTLEEPPPHVIFVLATTEAHKVLPTIVSRCQRFDFHRFTTRDILARLHHVAEGEGLTLDPAAAELLARAAQGGMRDALSLLDQAVAFCGNEIDAVRTRAMLGLADTSAVRGLLEAVADDRPADGLRLLDELTATGADLRQLQAQLAEDWRALMLARAGADIATMLDRTEEEAREIAALAGRFSLDELMACARVFARDTTPARGLPVPQLALELAFLECVTIRQGGSVVPAPVARPTLSAQPQPQMPAAEPAMMRAPEPAPARPAQQPAPSRPPQPAVDELDLDAIDRDEAPRPRPVAAQPAVSPEPRTSAPQMAALADDEDALLDDADDADEPDDVDDTPAPFAVAPPPPAQAAPSQPGAGTETVRRVQQQWATIRKVCKQRKSSIAALLTNARPVGIENGSTPALVIEADFSFHASNLRAPESKEIIEWAIEQVIDTHLRIRIVEKGEWSAPAGGSSATTAPVPAAAPVATRPQRNGVEPGSNGSQARQNGNGNGNGASVRETAAQTAAYTPQPAPASNGGARVPATPVDQEALEAEVRADPIIQEILRTYDVELTEVRPLDPEDA